MRFFSVNHIIIFSDEKQSLLPVEREIITDLPDEGTIPEKPVGEEAKSQRENGELQSNGITEPTSGRDMDQLPGSEGHKSRSFVFPCT